MSKDKIKRKAFLDFKKTLMDHLYEVDGLAAVLKVYGDLLFETQGTSQGLALEQLGKVLREKTLKSISVVDDFCGEGTK